MKKPIIIDVRTGPTKKLTAKEAIALTFKHYDMEVPPAMVDHLHQIMVNTVSAHNVEANRLLDREHARLVEASTQLDEAKSDLRDCQRQLATALIRVGRS